VKEPWPQSWNIIKMRMRKPAAGMESTSVSQGDILRLNIISTHNITYGTNELTICKMLFDICG
jgi:hypothetical protein